MVNIEKLYEATNGGADLFKAYFPDFDPGKKSNLVKLRDDDDHPSASIFISGGKWMIKDHGGSDNKAKSMIDFVMEREHLEFKDAVAHIDKLCGTGLATEPGKKQSYGAKMTKVAPSTELRIILRPSGRFTKKELLCLGAADRNGNPCITQETCDQFNLKPLDGYINATKDGETSWKVESTDDYPIMFYDYGDWGKIYQPFGEVRFMYYGKKPDHYLFGCNVFQEAWQKALKGEFPHVPEFSGGKKAKENEDGYIDEQEKDERWEALTICSGPSDALNVYRAGHIVCWPNSESEPIGHDTIRRLLKLTRNLYVLYDADETGIRNACDLALKNLDIQVISLPADLGEWRTGKRDKDGREKRCKDIKDFCMYYKKGYIDPYKEFKHRLVKLAKPLRFWTEATDKNGRTTFEISNAHLYRFLQANGFHKMTTNSAGSWVFVHIDGKVVEVIKDDDMVSRVKEFLISFITENTEYYSVTLENCIHRSKQINLESLKNLDSTVVDLDAYTSEAEYFFFRNCIVRVTAAGIETVKPDKCPYYVLKHKVIQHDLRMTKDLYSVAFTESGQWAIDNRDSNPPASPDWLVWQNAIDKLSKANELYQLEGVSDFDFIRYVYNTGNKYWREEAEAKANHSDLEPGERNSVNTNFLNKVTTLGYLLTKYKNPGVPKAVYCLETNVMEEDEGQHNGGTGKSIFMTCTKGMRHSVYIDGQDMKNKNWDFLFQRVDFDTDLVTIDDLASSIDMNSFLNNITGNMIVNPKYRDEFIIPYEKSPKLCFTSNHAIKRFGGSLKRRIHFVSFSDYYHSPNEEAGTALRSPLTEFGRNLITDYDEKDMNTFYNFMLQNVRTFMKYGLVDPDMPDIALRQMKANIGLDFINWADQWFEQDQIGESRFNKEINKDEAYQAWKATLNSKELAWVTPNKFKKKLQGWCKVRGYVYIPDSLRVNMTKTERDRNEIRFKDPSGKFVYGFYIENKSTEDLDDTKCQFDDGLPY
jgi:hypothetical protein